MNRDTDWVDGFPTGRVIRYDAMMAAWPEDHMFTSSPPDETLDVFVLAVAVSPVPLPIPRFPPYLPRSLFFFLP